MVPQSPVEAALPTNTEQNMKSPNPSFTPLAGEQRDVYDSVCVCEDEKERVCACMCVY